MRRWFRAFRVAFWSACHAETSRRVPHRSTTITVNVDADQSTATIRELEIRVDQLIVKAEYAAGLLGRLH